MSQARSIFERVERVETDRKSNRRNGPEGTVGSGEDASKVGPASPGGGPRAGVKGAGGEEMVSWAVGMALWAAGCAGSQSSKPGGRD